MKHLFRTSRWFDVLWLLLIAVYCLGGVGLVPLHGDEPTQISMGRDFYYQFVEGDWAQVRYAAWDALSPEAAAEQDLRLLNGTLPKYLFGFAAYAAGYEVGALNEQWVWGAGWDWNHENGHVPADDLLLRARLTSALLLALSAWAVYSIGLTVRSRLVAVLASAYYVLNPGILLNGRRAMMEGSMLAFGLLTVLAGLWLLRKPDWKRAALLGIAAGLAVASKHTAVFTVAAVFAGCALDWMWEALRGAKWRDSLREIGWLFGAGLLALSLFYALNPAWWGDPIGRAGEVLERRDELLAGQTATFGGYEDFSAQVSGFWRQVFLVQPMYAETEIDGFVRNQQELIGAYETSSFSGISIGGTALGGLLVLLLVLVGVGAALCGFVSISDRWLLGIWTIAMLSLTLLLTPLEWQRYYLPAYPLIALFAALGIAQCWQLLRRTQ